MKICYMNIKLEEHKSLTRFEAIKRSIYLFRSFCSYRDDRVRCLNLRLFNNFFLSSVDETAAAAVRAAPIPEPSFDN